MRCWLSAPTISMAAPKTLLHLRDRRELLFTKEEIASSLSVRRASIAAAFRALQSREIVCCRRGEIKIKSRGQLLKAADGLYAPQKNLNANDPTIRERGLRSLSAGRHGRSYKPTNRP
jgi:Crp-like helix-turn-helix domain